jgi:PsbN protein
VLAAAAVFQLLAVTRPLEPDTTWREAAAAALPLAVLLALTGFGIYTAFGPPSKRLTDPFDDHED